MKKALFLIAALILAALAAAGIMTVKYTNSYDYKSSYFDDGYIINGVRCDKMNYDEAAEKITSQWNARDVLIVGVMDEPLAVVSDADCTYDIRDQVAQIKKRHPVLCAINHYLNFPVSVQMPMKISSCSDAFREQIMHLPFLDRNSISETRDAYVDLSGPDFPIVPEIYGNQPDAKRVCADILKCMEMGQTKFVFSDEEYTAVPKVRSDDPKLLAYQKFCRDYLKQKITYDLGRDSYTVSQDELLAMLSDDLSGSADEKAVREFVAKIAKKYDNVGKERTVRSLTGRTVTVDNAQYGWSVDQDGETAKLMEDIASHKDVSRQPVWATQGLGSYSTDMGDTYVDIDISNQRLTYFEDGQEKLSFDVVTGCRNTRTTTPTGLFSVLAKDTNVTLKGRNADGSKYKSFVRYWMAFLGSSYGMHDASWRTSFGGDIWISAGSHGCVNCPPAQMSDLYDMVDYHTPVLVYY